MPDTTPATGDKVQAVTDQQTVAVNRHTEDVANAQTETIVSRLLATDWVAIGQKIALAVGVIFAGIAALAAALRPAPEPSPAPIVNVAPAAGAPATAPAPAKMTPAEFRELLDKVLADQAKGAK